MRCWDRSRTGSFWAVPSPCLHIWAGAFGEGLFASSQWGLAETQPATGWVEGSRGQAMGWQGTPSLCFLLAAQGNKLSQCPGCFSVPPLPSGKV